MINSPANEKVKEARALLHRRRREEAGRCLVEGVRLIEEAVRAGAIPTVAFYVAAAVEGRRAAALLDRLRGLSVPTLEVSPAVMAMLSDTVTPQGIVAVVPLPRVLSPSPVAWALIVDGLREPGNLGTVLRTAWAAGVEQVWLSPGTVDPFNPKALRGAMGAQFHLPVAARAWPEIAQAVRGMAVWLADASGDTNYHVVDWRQRNALVIGGEAAGASSTARQLATGRVRIPMVAGAESLNVAVAAGVVLFEARRQRCVALDA